MTQQSCIFCKIISKQIPATVIAENDAAIAIRDISPKAPIHYLLIPKVHVESVATLNQTTAPSASALLLLAQEIAKRDGISAFNLISNNGAGAGQSVFHLHFHFLAGKNIYDGGLQL